MTPKKVFLFCWLLVWALCFSPCLSLAAENQSETVKIVPVTSGYPAGGGSAFLVLLDPTPGRAGEPDYEGSSIKAVFTDPPGYEVSRLKHVALKSRPGSRLLMMRLSVPEDAAPGPARLTGYIEISPPGKEARKVDFAVEVKVLPKGSKAQVISPQMMKRLNQASAPGGPAGAGRGEASAAADPYKSKNLAWILLAVFAAGLGLNLTPCVYPLIPITVSLFGGGAGKAGESAALRSLGYWLGIVMMYSVLGVLVALSGSMLGQALASPLVTLAIVAVMLAMASSMFGLWEIRLPASLNNLAGASRSGVIGAWLMGLLVGVLAAPCVGPFVVGLLTHVARVGEVGYGFLMFLALSAGLGLPLTALAFFSGSISRLPGAGDWMIWVRSFFGVILTLMAVYMARPLLGDAVFAWVLGLTAAAGGIYLGFMEKSGRGGFLVFKRVAGALIIVGAAVFVWWFQTPGAPTGGKINWLPFSHQELVKAEQQGKPALIYFTADWCPPCRQLKAVTLPDARVAKAMESYAALKADLTTGGNAEDKKAIGRWMVRGVPTMVFLDARGRRITDLTVVGFIPPEDLVRRLETGLAMSRKAGRAGKE